jgi:hypothetical protein
MEDINQTFNKVTRRERVNDNVESDRRTSVGDDRSNVSRDTPIVPHNIDNIITHVKKRFNNPKFQTYRDNVFKNVPRDAKTMPREPIESKTLLFLTRMMQTYFPHLIEYDRDTPNANNKEAIIRLMKKLMSMEGYKNSYDNPLASIPHDDSKTELTKTHQLCLMALTNAAYYYFPTILQ